MTTLVTGGRGFVGRHLVDQLIGTGEPVISYNRDFAVDARDGLTMVQGELFDIPRLVQTLRDHGVERIIHTAGQSHPGLSIELPTTTFAANAEGTFSVLEAARMAGVGRVVNFSSECALGNVGAGTVIGEAVTPAPTTVYGVTKVTGELLGEVYTSLYAVHVVSLRITEVYGPGLWMPSLLGDMIRAALRDEPFHRAQGGDHPFQFVHVEDVATAARLAATAPAPSQPAYNISGGRQVTVRETAALLADLLPDAKFDIGPGLLPAWDHMGAFDITAAERDLGYRPQWDLDRGLRSQIEWLRS
ncbi:polysaccharide biosynthesis family protein [Mycobacterium sp. 852013-51886_SCH5428379]|uniref:NAD-dependent epimerase/dehydratase family protein n=1 Tax=Mycobacterium sp. 852013-51886_SCH5428379 TaxID=1834111 RepID=UPI000801D4FE|nr:NAD(P)-dependent oxidoreductase [Mycobacterium sp. 852013-51886_SCH5428379]OBB61217.1 polysaccharide biosynthesis family protein [Mycobacterium sp. 852013-51886_SCH5428379]